MPSVRILHISDLHEKAEREKDNWRRQKVLGDPWFDNLKAILDADGRAPDIVAFTGDIADWGRAEEYRRAHEFIQKTLSSLAVPPERFFVVPGNHDIHRPTNPDSWGNLREVVRQRYEVCDDWIAGVGQPPFGAQAEWLADVLAREAPYREWVRTGVNPELDPSRSPHERLGYRRSLAGWSFPVHIVGLDSAFLCGEEHEDGKLCVTEGQGGRLLHDADGYALKGLRIALCHHPSKMFLDRDAALVNQLLAENADILLRGHLHDTALTATVDPNHRRVELAAGALYGGNNWPNSVNLVDLVCDDDGTLQRVDVWVRAWNASAKWHDDNSVYAGTKNGRFALDLRTLRASSATADPAMPPTAPAAPASPPPPKGTSERAQAYRRKLEAAAEQSAAVVTARSEGIGRFATLIHKDAGELDLPVVGPLFGDPDAEQKEQAAQASARGHMALRKLSVQAHNGLSLEAVFDAVPDYIKPFPYPNSEEIVARGSCNVLLADGSWATEKVLVVLGYDTRDVAIVSADTKEPVDEQWVRRKLDILTGDRLPALTTVVRGAATQPLSLVTTKDSRGGTVSGEEALRAILEEGIAAARWFGDGAPDDGARLVDCLRVAHGQRRTIVTSAFEECAQRAAHCVEFWSAFDVYDVDEEAATAKLEIKLKPAGAPLCSFRWEFGLNDRRGGGGSSPKPMTFIAKNAPVTAAGVEVAPSERSVGPASFVSLATFAQRTAAQDVLDGGSRLPFEGRATEFEQLSAFFRDPDARLIAVYGEGGVGKTRFVTEAARRALSEGLVQHAYAATPTAEQARDWYRDALPNSTAVMIVDEPQSGAFVRTLLHELATTAKGWKVLLAVRSQNDPIVAELRRAREKLVAPALVLKPLGEPEALTLAKNCLRLVGIDVERYGGEQRLAHWIVRTSGALPVWILLAVHMLQRSALQELPVDAWQLAQTYFREALNVTTPGAVTSQQLKELMRWVALLQPLNRESSETLEYIRKEAGFETVLAVDEAINELRERRVLVCYGVNARMVEIRPDVMRDFVVLDWLTSEHAGTRAVTGAGDDLVRRLLAAVNGDQDVPAVRRIVSSLGRLETLLDYKVRFLDPLASLIEARAVQAKDANEQLDILSVATLVGEYRVAEFARIARQLRTRERPDVEIDAAWGVVRRTRAELLRQLPWALFTTGQHARTEDECRLVIDEMTELLKNEAAVVRDDRKGMRANDGMSASELLRRLLVAERGPARLYRKLGTEVATTVLDALAKGTILPDLFVTSVVSPNLMVETDESWVELDKIVWSRGVVQPGSSNGGRVLALVQRLWELLAKDLPEQVHLQAWQLLAQHHQDLNAATIGDKGEGGWRTHVRALLSSCLAVLSGRTLTNREWFIARKIWDWHLRVEKDPTAQECEHRFNTRPDARFNDLLFVDEDWKKRDERVAVEAATLSAVSKDDLRSFFRDGIRVVLDSGDEWRLQTLQWIARRLGSSHLTPSVEAYVDEIIRTDSSVHEFNIALSVLAEPLQRRRDQADDDGLAAMLSHWLGLVRHDRKRDLLRGLYLNANVIVQASLRQPDWDLIVQSLGLFEERAVRWRFLGLAFGANRSATMAIIDDALLAMDPFDLDDALSAFWAGFHAVLMTAQREKRPVLTLEQLAWFLSVVARVPDLRAIIHHIGSDLEEIAASIDAKFSLSWLADVLEKRIAFLTPLIGQAREPGGRGHVWVLPERFLFATLTKRASEEDPVDREALSRILAHNDDDYSVSHELPELIATLDPAGAIAPALVKAALDALPDTSDVYKVAAWARYGRVYSVGSPSWRRIATSASAFAERYLSAKDTQAIYYQLYDHQPGVLSGPIGEVNPHWLRAVTDAHIMLDAEENGPLRNLLRWRLELAEQELKFEQGRVEEERNSFR